MVELHLDRLEDGRSELVLDHELTREPLEFQGHRVEGFTAKVRGELLVENMDQKVLVHGEFRATRTMNCDHCGSPFELEYPATIEVVILCNPLRGGDEEVGSDDNWVIQQPGGLVDLSDAVLEAVVLDQPQNAVDPRHRDLEPLRRFGEATEESDQDSEGESIDPRWEALRQLRDESDSTESS